jgi:hypothetical protein
MRVRLGRDEAPDWLFFSITTKPLISLWTSMMNSKWLPFNWPGIDMGMARA